jgi:hypothetical protein
MKGLGAFQRAQIKHHDPRILDFFRNVREAIDVPENLTEDFHAELGDTIARPGSFNTVLLLLQLQKQRFSYLSEIRLNAARAARLASSSVNARPYIDRSCGP